jgi:hypothetical protein
MILSVYMALVINRYLKVLRRIYGAKREDVAKIHTKMSFAI